MSKLWLGYVLGRNEKEQTIPRGLVIGFGIMLVVGVIMAVVIGILEAIHGVFAGVTSNHPIVTLGGVATITAVIIHRSEVDQEASTNKEKSLLSLGAVGFLALGIVAIIDPVSTEGAPSTPNIVAGFAAIVFLLCVVISTRRIQKRACETQVEQWLRTVIVVLTVWGFWSYLFGGPFAAPIVRDIRPRLLLLVVALAGAVAFDLHQSYRSKDTPSGTETR